MTVDAAVGRFSSCASVHERIRSMATARPDAVAVQMPGVSLSYQELMEWADRIATVVQASQRDRQCPIILSPGMDLMTLIKVVVGVLEAGCAYVYLGEFYPAERIAEILNDINPACILCNRASRKQAEDLIDGRARRIALIDIDTADDQPIESLTRIGVCPEDLLAVQFTSGTTGRPKGIKIDHCRYLLGAKGSLLKPSDRVATLLSFNVGGIFIPLMRGSTIFPYNPTLLSPAELLKWIKDQRINVIAPPVSLFRRLADIIPHRGYLSEIREVFLHGQAVFPVDVERFRENFPAKARLFTLYSSTETFGITRLQVAPSFDPKGKPVPAGFPVHHKSLSIVDKLGNPLPAGTMGEVAVTSRYLSPGYWKNPVLSAQRFRSSLNNPRLRTFFTGDLGFIDERGCLHLHGRKDRQVKVRGFRVELEAVEAALATLDYVSEAAVIARKDHRGDMRLVAYVVVRDGRRLSIERLRAHLILRLPFYMVPARFYFLKKMPQLISLKVNLAQLPAPTLQREWLSSTLVEPRNDLEARILDQWKAILGESDIGISDSFFELGGDSLSAVLLINAIEHELGYALPNSLISSLDTVEHLCNGLQSTVAKEKRVASVHLDQSDYNKLLSTMRASQLEWASAVSLITIVNQNGTRPPLFWCFNSPSTESRALAKAMGPDQPIYCLFSGIFAIRPFDAVAVQRIARHYMEEICIVQPHGPYLLGGNCSGAKIMVEIAHLLLNSGEMIAKLICMEAFDSRLLSYPGDMLLLYGRESHLRAYEPFGWGEADWERQFLYVPQVRWLPGTHGEFFSTRHVPELARLVKEALVQSCESPNTPL